MQRRAAQAFAVLALAGLLVPTVAAEPLFAQAVGRLVVDATGLVAGDNLEARIAELDGAIHALSVQGVPVLSSLAVDDLRVTEKLSGVGSSQVLLKGDRAVLRLHDDRRPSLHVDALAEATARWTLAPGVRATQDAQRPGLARLSSADAQLGALVATGGRLAIEGDVVVMRLPAGGAGAFLSSTGEAAQDDALFAAGAAQRLGATIVAEVQGSQLRASEATFRRDVATRTLALQGGIETRVVSTLPALLAFDVAYEALPAREARDVAVFLDGRPVPALVFGGEGRHGIHVEVPAGSHRIQILTGGGSGSASQAQAERRAESGARAYGDFRHHPNGKLEGAFLTAIVPDGRSTLLAYTSLDQGAQVFDLVQIDGGARAAFASADGHRFQLRGPRADATLVDDAYATHIIDARARVDVQYDLADGIAPKKDGDRVVDLGAAGALVLLGQGALHVDGDDVRVRLEEGARLVYRGGSAAGHASEGAVRAALAQGRLGAQILAGWQDDAVATASTLYFDGVEARATPGESIAVDFAPDGLASSFVLDVRGWALAARSASDVAVSVDGVSAVPAASAEDVFADAPFPRAYVELADDGALRVIARSASAPGERVRVLVESRVSDAAQEATADGFGSFRLFDDGTAVGSFVTLHADQSVGAISGFTLLASRQPVIESLAVGDSPFLASGTDGASVLRLENRDAKLEFSDTTSGFARIIAKRDTDLALRFAQSLLVEERAGGVLDLTTKGEGGRDVGSLVVTGATEVLRGDDGQVLVRLPAGAQALFRAHAGIEAELSTAQRSMIDQAIASGRVASAIVVQTQGVGSAQRGVGSDGEGVTIASAEHAGEVTSSVTATYDAAVQVVAAATRERVELTVSSLQEEGRTILVALDPRTVPGLADGRARILYDGERIAQADSYADVLDASDDGGRAEAFVLAGEAGVQVLVSIPHFSVHVVTLEEDVVDGDSPFFMYATAVLAVLLIVETAIMALRRKKSRSPTPPQEK